VIAFERDNRMLLFARQHSIDDFARMRAAVDIVAEENVQGVLDRIGLKAGVDAPEHLAQKINSSVNVADSVDANTAGNSRFHFLLNRRCQ
jgi:hypothetical protein